MFNSFWLYGTGNFFSTAEYSYRRLKQDNQHCSLCAAVKFRCADLVSTFRYCKLSWITECILQHEMPRILEVSLIFIRRLPRRTCSTNARVSARMEITDNSQQYRWGHFQITITNRAMILYTCHKQQQFPDEFLCNSNLYPIKTDSASDFQFWVRMQIIHHYEPLSKHAYWKNTTNYITNLLHYICLCTSTN